MSTGTFTADPVAGRAACEPRTAFVLAGGAALGAMQAGMVHALYERGIAPDLLIGTSVGALNAAFLAAEDERDAVTMPDVISALEEELRKLGRPVRLPPLPAAWELEAAS